MKPQYTQGFSSVTFIGIVAIAVVVIGGVALLQGSSDRSLVETQTQQPSIIQNIAENKTESVTQAVLDRTQQITQQLDSADTASEPVTVSDSVPAEVPKPVAEVPAPTVITPQPEPTPAPVVAVTPGTFTDYSADKLTNGTNVLFFHAQWCPTCRGLEDNLNANLGNIPENVHILKLDYDTQTELKKKYDVVRQHTLVVVDANGNEVRKLTGLTNTLDQVVSQL